MVGRAQEEGLMELLEGFEVVEVATAEGVYIEALERLQRDVVTACLEYGTNGVDNGLLRRSLNDFRRFLNLNSSKLAFSSYELEKVKALQSSIYEVLQM